MANKPAKRNISNSTPSAPKIDDGVNVLYIGLNKLVKHVCPECNKVSGKGILREYKNTMYCSRYCVHVMQRRESIA